MKPIRLITTLTAGILFIATSGATVKVHKYTIKDGLADSSPQQV